MLSISDMDLESRLKNPMDQVLFVLYDRLNLLYFLLRFLDGRMRAGMEDVRRQVENSKGSRFSGPFHGTSLVITDLTGKTDNGWLFHGRTGKVSVEGKEFLEKLEWVARREGALASCRANRSEQGQPAD